MVVTKLSDELVAVPNSTFSPETHQPAVLKSYEGHLLLFSSVLLINRDSYVLIYALYIFQFPTVVICHQRQDVCVCVL